jgi:hypothetical protein
VWDQQSRFEIQLGPLSLADFESFLPTEWRFGVLCDLVRFYVNDDFEFNVRLILRTEEIPPVDLSSEPALSWTSWLGPMRSIRLKNYGHWPPAQENPYIVITPDALRSRTGSIKSRILHRLPRSKQTALLGLMTRTAVKNTLVVLQGKPATSMYVITRGKVQLSRCEEHGKETVVGMLGEGDCFGERALLKHKPYSETALALTDCEFSVIRREHLAFAMINDQSLRRTIDAYVNCDESEDLTYNPLEHRR